MGKAEMVGASDEVHPGLQCYKAMSGMPTCARQSRQPFPHGGIEAESYGRIERFAAWRQAEQVLCFLKSSPGDLAGNFHHPFLFRMLDHRRDTEFGPDFQTGSSRPGFLLHFFAKDPQNALGIRIPPICRDQKRLDGPATGTNLVEQAICQGRVSLHTDRSCQP